MPFRRENFDVHYGEQRVAFGLGEDGAPETMTIKMEGNTGARLATNDGKFMHGAVQVEGVVSDASGAVTAFYTRSSDDYNLANHGSFSEVSGLVMVVLLVVVLGRERQKDGGDLPR